MLKYRQSGGRVAAIAVVFGLVPTVATAAGPTWEASLPVPGALDMEGPRSDGLFVLAGSAALYLLDAAGNIQPLARGPGGYHEDRGQEAYIAVSPGNHVDGADCDFAKGHIAFSVNAPQASPTPVPAAGLKQRLVPTAVVDFVGQWGIPTVVFILLLGVVAGLAVQAFRNRAK